MQKCECLPRSEFICEMLACSGVALLGQTEPPTPPPAGGVLLLFALLLLFMLGEFSLRDKFVAGAEKNVDKSIINNALLKY